MQSRYKTFPLRDAERLKRDWPEIWRAGGNIRGNQQFVLLRRIVRQGGAATTREQRHALALREAWAARHYNDFRLPGVIAQVKWLVVGSRGLRHMQRVIRAAQDSLVYRGEDDEHA